ncbi:TolC family protein [Breoghania sp. L-A4]|uniref:TolC family protein n=1 Tax=Breoghania sp. L-A4 TaxID=2304600 RepID=UPI000E35D53E|nr:TolC family protein [Breoghania sp. L-A4]AXS42099.1 TolC family protein [Breoghania sp. L-A4]
MSRPIIRLLFATLAPVALAGCVTGQQIDQYSAPDAGFSTVSTTTGQAIGKQTVWAQNKDDAQALAVRVHALVHKKTINADTAVQVALLNNKGLQAAYAEMGLSAAEAWQQTMLPNPKVSIGIFGIASPELGAYRSIEGLIAANILALATRRSRVAIADTRFRQAQLTAVLETLRLATETRQAWINAVGAFETTVYFNQAQNAADAASELAQKLGESGAMPKGNQAREHAFYAELSGQKAQARLAARLAKEKLTRLMGLWGVDVDYYVPDYLPRLPASVARRNAIETEALQRRVDLQIARLELQAVAQSHGLTVATRYVTDLEIIGGFESERERDEDGGRKTVTTLQAELEFVIPIFDSGEARQRKGELAYMRAANKLAEKAVNVRSEARSAYMAYTATHAIARHYQNSVLPLRTGIEEESLLTYNGMITNTFELLADTRAKISTLLQSVAAKRDFWLADANLLASTYGGGAGAAAGDGEAMALADSGGGH